MSRKAGPKLTALEAAAVRAWMQKPKPKQTLRSVVALLTPSLGCKISPETLNSWIKRKRGFNELKHKDELLKLIGDFGEPEKMRAAGNARSYELLKAIENIGIQNPEVWQTLIDRSIAQFPDTPAEYFEHQKLENLVGRARPTEAKDCPERLLIEMCKERDELIKALNALPSPPIKMASDEIPSMPENPQEEIAQLRARNKSLRTKNDELEAKQKQIDILLPALKALLELR